MPAHGESAATSLWALHPPHEPTTMVLMVGGSIRRGDIPALCRRAHVLLADSDAEVIICDVGALDATDAVVVDALARLQLTARRLGRRISLRGARPELEDLLAFVGLGDVVPTLSLEGKRQPEERKETLRIEEETNPGDLAP